MVLSGNLYIQWYRNSHGRENYGTTGCSSIPRACARGISEGD